MVTFNAEDYPVLEAGTYEATFDRTEESEEPGQYGYWIDWYFPTKYGNLVVDVMGRSSLPDRWTRATKARQWYEAIAGRELAKGEAADTATLKGTPVILTLTVKETEKGDKRNSIVDIRRHSLENPPTDAVAITPDPEYEAWKAAQAAKQAAVVAANAEQPPPPTEPPADLGSETEAA